MNGGSQLLTLIAKDIRIEARGKQTIGLVLVLGVLIVVVLGLGLGGQGHVAAFNATAVLWVAYLFSGVLCFEKTMSIDRNDGILAALLMAPVNPGTIFLAKLISNLMLMLAVALVVTPAGILFFGFDLSASPGMFAIVMLLGIIGFAAVGTLFAATVSSSRLQGGLLAMMVFPIALPLVITSTQLMIGQFRDGVSPGMHGIGILIAYDVIFMVASWITYEWVLEP